MRPLNALIERNDAAIREYVRAIPSVPDPEDKLQVNRYMELAQKSKPIIMISLDEIFRTHQLIYENLDQLAPSKDDPLRLIMNDLGEPPSEFSEEDKDRELQLTLTNRFKVDMEGMARMRYA
jgi:Ras GTPase-activating-like protein IQGAP2/3